VFFRSPCSSAFAFNPAFLPELPAVDDADSEFIEFCNKQQFWLDDYVLFKVLKQHFNDTAWVEWPEQWKFRDAKVLQKSRQQYQQQIVELKWQQYQLQKRWLTIRKTATELGILLFGDMPIFIAHDSADVWAHPEWFRLDSTGNMTVVSGVPPDYFSETGQRWGNPHYDWESMQEDDFSWWKSRIHHHLEQFDLVRIDHFRGLESAWVIDASCETAIDGEWQKMPGDALLATIKSSIEKCYEQLPFVAEDLGIITPEVTALRKKYHLPGMSILQFGFDEFEDNPHKPQNIKQDTVVYTGTHDNDTTKGWFNSLEEHVKNHVLAVLDLPVANVLDEQGAEISAIDSLTAGATDEDRGCWSDNVEMADFVVERMIENAMRSPANLCIIPIQDYLHFGSEARMNTPGTVTGNWQWQLQWDAFEHKHDSSRMKKMRSRNENTQRISHPEDSV